MVNILLLYFYASECVFPNIAFTFNTGTTWKYRLPSLPRKWDISSSNTRCWLVKCQLFWLLRDFFERWWRKNRILCKSGWSILLPGVGTNPHRCSEGAQWVAWRVWWGVQGGVGGCSKEVCRSAWRDLVGCLEGCSEGCFEDSRGISHAYFV